MITLQTAMSGFLAAVSLLLSFSDRYRDVHAKPRPVPGQVLPLDVTARMKKRNSISPDVCTLLVLVVHALQTSTRPSCWDSASSVHVAY